MKTKPKWIRLLKALFLQTLAIATLVTQAAVWLMSTRVALFPGQETIQSIAGSFAEIVAGLYGLTLASYTFFLSRIDGLSAGNPTLDSVTLELKRNFKYLIWHITFQVLMTLIFATILMYAQAPGEGSAFAFWYRLLCNEFLVFSGFSVVLILYYSVLVINPNVIESEAARLKAKLGGKEADGSLLEFLNTYQKLGNRIRQLLPAEAASQLRQDQSMSLNVTMALLQQLYPQLMPLLPELEAVHRYYECLVNCKEIGVSQEMCGRAGTLLDVLNEIQ